MTENLPRSLTTIVLPDPALPEPTRSQVAAEDARRAEDALRMRAESLRCAVQFATRTKRADGTVMVTVFLSRFHRPGQP